MEESKYIILVTNFNNNNEEGNTYYLNNSKVEDNKIKFNEIFNNEHKSVSFDTLKFGNDDKVLLIKKSDTIKEYKIVNDVKISVNQITFNPISVDWQEDKDIILNSLFDYEPTVENTTNVLSKLARNIFMETNYFKLNSLTAENIKNITNKEKIQEFMKLVYITEKDGFDVEEDKKNYNLVMHPEVNNDNPAVNNANPAVNNAIHIFNYIDKINNTEFEENEENEENIIENNKQKIQELLNFKDKQNTELNKQQNTELLEFNNEINNIINDTENNNIITFLKINKDTKPNILFNQVFDSIKETQSKKNKTTNSPVKKITEITKSTSMILTHESVNYLFGNFQQIFTRQPPKEIADKMDIITNNIINKKPVFLLNCGLYKDKKMPLLVNDNDDNSIIYNLCKNINIDYIRVTIQNIYNNETILNNEIFTLYMVNNNNMEFEELSNKKLENESNKKLENEYKTIKDLDKILSDNINKNIYPNLIYISFYSEDNNIKSAGDLIICDFGKGDYNINVEFDKFSTVNLFQIIYQIINKSDELYKKIMENDEDSKTNISNITTELRKYNNQLQNVTNNDLIKTTVTDMLMNLGIERVEKNNMNNSATPNITNKPNITIIEKDKQILLNLLNPYKNQILRKELNNILSVKHQKSKALFNSPNYIDICLESYCPTNQNCFKTEKKIEKEGEGEGEGEIEKFNLYNRYMSNYLQSYKKIFGNNTDKERLNEDDIYNKYNSNGGDIEFYKDIVICVFGTFDTSQFSNSKKSYININRLKQIFYNEEPYNNNEEPYNNNDEIQKEINNLKTNYKKNPFRVLFNIKDTQKMIEKIDNTNASTGIGTLEFLDQLSKFGSVNNLCSIDKTNLDYNPYLDNDDFQLIEKKYQPENKIKM